MNQKDKYYLPQLLDQPFKIHLLTIDEFLILALPILVIGFIFAEMVAGFLIGFLGLFAVKKLKGEQGATYLRGLLYWYLPPLVKYKMTPPSYMRTFQG